MLKKKDKDNVVKILKEMATACEQGECETCLFEDICDEEFIIPPQYWINGD